MTTQKSHPESRVRFDEPGDFVREYNPETRTLSFHDRNADYPILKENEAHLENLVEYLRSVPQIYAPLEHIFCDGYYKRKVTMPAGALILGHMHKTRHQNMIIEGKVIVSMNGETHEITAPFAIVSDENVRKVLFIQEDTVWITIHENPDNCRDIAKLEERLLDMNPDFLKLKGSMDVDTFRKSLTLKQINLCQQ